MYCRRSSSKLLLAVGFVILAFSTSATLASGLAYQYANLNEFNGSNGAQVLAGLIFDGNGNLYGTTSQGGLYGEGTVFELSPVGGGWTETVLYNFGSIKYDGTNSQSGLVLDAAGNLYGTTVNGGRYNKGTVFELSPLAGSGWTETVLHSFGYGHDGTYPMDPLAIDTAGNFYGTTYNGGTVDTCMASGVIYTCGTVFELSTTGTGGWTYAVIHNFAGGTTDGNFPVAGISLDGLGNLYGQASYGGESGGGVLFELVPVSGKWREKIIHPWGRIHDGRPDGTYPYGTLVFDSVGDFYGTALIGGTHGDMGMVFKFVPNSEGTGWVEQSIHGFGDGTDGQTPLAGVIVDASGNLFGTASKGGTSGDGMVYELIPDGPAYLYRPIYEFSGNSDGGWPAAPLVLDNSGHLYGTTEYGGLAADCSSYPLAGCGVIFELTAK